MSGAGVAIVREGRLLLSPRGPSPHLPGPPEPRVHLGWIGGGLLPGESPEDGARREAREEIGCDVELLDASSTHGALSNSLLQSVFQPVLIVRGELAVFRARALGEPRPVDVPALTWVPLSLLPSLRVGIPVEALADRGVEIVGEVGPGTAFIGNGSVTGALRELVERLGPDALA